MRGLGGEGVQARLMERTPSMSDFNEVVYGQVYTGGSILDTCSHMCAGSSFIFYNISYIWFK